METRTERFKKYREQILAMPDDFFSPDGTCVKRLTKEEIKEAPSFQPAEDFSGFGGASEMEDSNDLEIEEDGERTRRLTPYTVYLQQRKKAWIAKIVVSGLALIALALFFVFFVGGPNNG